MQKLKAKKKATSSLGITKRNIKNKPEMCQIVFQINRALRDKKNKERPEPVQSVGYKVDIPRTQDVRN